MWVQSGRWGPGGCVAGLRKLSMGVARLAVEVHGRAMDLDRLPWTSTAFGVAGTTDELSSHLGS